MTSSGADSFVKVVGFMPIDVFFLAEGLGCRYLEMFSSCHSTSCRPNTCSFLPDCSCGGGGVGTFFSGKAKCGKCKTGRYYATIDNSFLPTCKVRMHVCKTIPMKKPQLTTLPWYVAIISLALFFGIP